MGPIEAAYQEVLDAIGCDGEERCLLLTHAVREAMKAVLEEALNTDYIRATNARGLHRLNVIVRIDALAALQQPPEPRERAGEEEA